MSTSTDTRTATSTSSDNTNTNDKESAKRIKPAIPMKPKFIPPIAAAPPLINKLNQQQLAVLLKNSRQPLNHPIFVHSTSQATTVDYHAKPNEMMDASRPLSSPAPPSPLPLVLNAIQGANKRMDSEPIIHNVSLHDNKLHNAHMNLHMHNQWYTNTTSCMENQSNASLTRDWDIERHAVGGVRPPVAMMTTTPSRKQQPTVGKLSIERIECMDMGKNEQQPISPSLQRNKPKRNLTPKPIDNDSNVPVPTSQRILLVNQSVKAMMISAQDSASINENDSGGLPPPPRKLSMDLSRSTNKQQLEQMLAQQQRMFNENGKENSNNRLKMLLGKKQRSTSSSLDGTNLGAMANAAAAAAANSTNSGHSVAAVASTSDLNLTTFGANKHQMIFSEVKQNCRLIQEKHLVEKRRPQQHYRPIDGQQHTDVMVIIFLYI